MTWLKLGDEFADECATVGLSDAAFRTHVEGLGWAMRRETGGRLTRQDVRRFAETTGIKAAIDELCAVGFWRRDGDYVVIVHHMEHQPEPDVLARRRELTADRVRKHRRKKAGLDVPDEVGNAVTERVTRVGSGLVGTGSTTEAPTEKQEPPLGKCVECGHREPLDSVTRACFGGCRPDVAAVDFGHRSDEEARSA